jgi:DNA-binding response OmpR family regulator
VARCGGRILITEDEPDIAQRMRRYLERDGHAVRVARDGHESLQVARFEHPNLISLDVRLPDLDGLADSRPLLETLGIEPLLGTSVTAEDLAAIITRGLGRVEASADKPLEQ